MNIGNYIRDLRISKGITQEDLGKIAGVQRAAVQKWECGKTQNLKRATIQKLSEYFEVSPATFVIDEKKSSTEINDFSQYGIMQIKTKKIPMLGKIACGKPMYCGQEYETYIETSNDIQADFCLIAQGDSMINARIFDGDVIFVREQPNVENGEIAVVIIDDTVTLKRLYKYTDRIELRPENPIYSPLNYEGEELNNIRILGKAVAFQSWIK